jgi:excinuclease UvrABC ATPase subunit
LIADGSPEDVAEVEESFTGKYLRSILPAREVAAA